MSEVIDPVIDPEQRPVPRAQLPFEVRSERQNGFPYVILVYHGRPPGGGRPQPYYLHVGDPDGVYADPMGLAVLKLMTLFKDLEATVDALKKTAYEADAQRQAMKAQLETAQRQAGGRRGQLKGPRPLLNPSDLSVEEGG